MRPSIMTLVAGTRPGALKLAVVAATLVGRGQRLYPGRTGRHPALASGALGLGTLPALRLAVLCWLVLSTALVSQALTRGFDLTDEAFYLVWLNDPLAYELMYQPFAYLLGPVYAGLGHSLVALRIVGYALLLASAFLLGWCCERDLRRQGLDRGGPPLSWLAAAMVPAFLLVWIPTPSYNFLGNLGALLLLSGLILWRQQPGERRLDLASSALVAAGAWVGFFGKPLLVLLAALAAAAMILRGAARAGQRPGWVLRALVAGLGSALLILLTISATFSVPDFFRTIFESQAILALDNSLPALPGKLLGELARGPVTLPLSAAALLLALLAPKRANGRAFQLLLVLAALLALAFLARGVLQLLRTGFAGDHVAVSSVVLALLYAAWLISSAAAPRRALVVPLLLVPVPLAVSLGTFNNTLHQMTLSLPFLLIAWFLLARIDPTPWRSLLATLAALLASALCLGVGLIHPYNHGSSLLAQRQHLQLRGTSDTLLVDSGTADYAASLRAAGRRLGFAPGMTVLDLSGGGPGSTALLGGKAPVLPWITHITPHWADIVWSGLDDSERRSTWVIGPVSPVYARTRAARDIARLPSRCTPAGTHFFWGRQRALTLCRPPGRS